jgi:fumarate hydratase, class II
MKLGQGNLIAVLELEEHLLPQAEALAAAIEAKPNEWSDIVKIGRTHLQDTVPLTVGQEWSGYARTSCARRWRASAPPRPACSSWRREGPLSAPG